MGSEPNRILIISSDSSALQDTAIMSGASVNCLPTPDPEAVIMQLRTWQFKLVVLVPSKNNPPDHSRSKIAPLKTPEEAEKFLEQLLEKCLTASITLPLVLINPRPQDLIAHL